jgi:hypothetical protein
MTTAASEVRMQRLCDVCWKLDDHPRHVTSVPPQNADGSPGEGLPTQAEQDALKARTDVPLAAALEIMDPSTVVRHMDCCASRGCSTCLGTLDATGGAHGDALLNAIQTGVTEHLSSPAPVEGGEDLAPGTSSPTEA